MQRAIRPAEAVECRPHEGEVCVRRGQPRAQLRSGMAPGVLRRRPAVSRTVEQAAGRSAEWSEARPVSVRRDGRRARRMAPEAQGRLTMGLAYIECCDEEMTVAAWLAHLETGVNRCEWTRELGG